MTRQDPGAATGQPIDWSRYRKCPVCHASLGEPCLSQSGTAGRARDEPHSNRPSRSGLDDVIAELTAERFGTVMPPDRRPG